MENRTIRSEAEYERALREVAKYFENEPRAGTPEAARFDQLAEAIAAYESLHWPIEAAPRSKAD